MGTPRSDPPPSGKPHSQQRPAAARGTGAVMVTGACGRLGKHVVRVLHRERHVIGVDRRPFPDKPKDVAHEQVDIRRKKLKDVFRAERVGKDRGGALFARHHPDALFSCALMCSPGVDG